MTDTFSSFNFIYKKFPLQTGIEMTDLLGHMRMLKDGSLGQSTHLANAQAVGQCHWQIRKRYSCKMETPVAGGLLLEGDDAVIQRVLPSSSKFPPLHVLLRPFDQGWLNRNSSLTQGCIPVGSDGRGSLGKWPLLMLLERSPSIIVPRMKASPIGEGLTGLPWMGHCHQQSNTVQRTVLWIQSSGRV